MKIQSKKQKIVVLVMAFIMSGMIASAQMTGLGDFEVKNATEQMVVGDQKVETFVITYSDFSEPIYVGIVKGKKCDHYVVRTEGFEIEYRNKNQRFGVSYTDEDFATIDKKEIANKINRENFLYQKLISKGEKSDDYRVNLIASYLPDVMKVG